MSKNPPEVNVRPELKPATLSLAEQLRKHLEVDHKTGAMAFAANTYVDVLPEGITAETIKKINDHHSTLAAAGTLVVGEAGVGVMKKIKSLDRVEATLPMVGKDAVKFSFQRERQVNVPGQKGQPNTTKTVYGASNAQFEMYADHPVGELRKVRESLAMDAMAAFASK